MGLPVVGTLGILVAAKRKGIIPEFAPVLNSLKKHRFYIADDVMKKALQLVNDQ